MRIHIVLVLVIAVLVSVFAVQNSYFIDLKFLWWTLQKVSLVLVVIFSFTIGVLAALLLCFYRQLKCMIKIRELTEQNQQLVRELDRIRCERKEPKE
ncbi:MAG: DUF1049 domain-containing protein [Pelotomaculum sp.]|nr:DUF1049 domain-containing protein [Pelotomaculum sp.]